MTDANTLFLQLTSIAQQWPDNLYRTAREPATKKLLAQTAAVIEAAGQFLDHAGFVIAIDNLNSDSARSSYDGAVKLETIFQRVLARAELNSDIGGNSHFVGSGSEFAAVNAIKQIVSQSKEVVRFVDPYAGLEVLNSFAILCDEGIKVEVLADRKLRKPDLISSMHAWAKEYGTDRPLEVRLAPSKTLHDRAIFIDNSRVWGVGQSFNALAARSATSMIPIAGDAGMLKIEAYGDLWQAAEKTT